MNRLFDELDATMDRAGVRQLPQRPGNHSPGGKS